VIFKTNGLILTDVNLEGYMVSMQ